MARSKYADVVKVKEVRTVGGDVSEVNELLRQGWLLFDDGVMPTHDSYGRPGFLYVLFLTREAQKNSARWA